jgi:hypothetical protein
VDVVGGRVVKDGSRFLRTLRERRRWGEATQRTCFQRATYKSLFREGNLATDPHRHTQNYDKKWWFDLEDVNGDGILSMPKNGKIDFD